jgi:SAM-dependent methyltransferase
VMGLDISAPLLDRARWRGRDAAVGNVVWREGDAQVAPLPAAHFDLVVSRFGVMFFDDPTAAFVNIARAIKPGGRLHFACWQPTERNPWYTFPSRSLAPYIELPALPFGQGPGPFAFGDPDHVRAVLTAAGFTNVGIDGFETRLGLGTDGSVEATIAFVTRGPLGQALAAAPDDARRSGIEALRSAMADHVGEGEVRFPAAAWFVTARR